jgi:fructoselysine-6-P-deglycase FrlB-like protein
VLLVVANRSDEDRDDLRKMGEGFRAAGARVVMFDNILDPDDTDRVKLENNLAVARNAGIAVIPAESILKASPDRPRFSCLDHIHMTEPYHRLMAKQWLKVLVNSGVSP